MRLAPTRHKLGARPCLLDLAGPDDLLLLLRRQQRRAARIQLAQINREVHEDRKRLGLPQERKAS